MPIAIALATQQIPELYSTLSFVSLLILLVTKKGWQYMPSRLFILMHLTKLHAYVVVATTWERAGTRTARISILILTAHDNIK